MGVRLEGSSPVAAFVGEYLDAVSRGKGSQRRSVTSTEPSTARLDDDQQSHRCQEVAA